MPAHDMLTLAVLHDDPIVAAGLCVTLARETGIAVLSPLALPGPRFAAPRADVAVTDHRQGLAVLEGMLPPWLDAVGAVVMLTGMDRERDIRRAVQAGARGYLLQGAPVVEIAQAVRAVHRGQRHFCQRAARRMAESLSYERLTQRETEVLHWMSRGACNKSIATQLGIAVGTVKVHVKGILEKLGAASRTHAVIVAGERGLVPAGPPGLEPVGPMPGIGRARRVPAPAHGRVVPLSRGRVAA